MKTNKLTKHIEYRNKRVEEVQARLFNGNRWDFGNANAPMSAGDCRKEADYCMRDCEKVAQETFEIGYQRGVDDTETKNGIASFALLVSAAVLIAVSFFLS